MGSDAVDEARRVYERFQDEQLAASELGSMAAWVSSGKCPTAAELRSAGFTSDGDPVLRLARKAFIRDWGFAIPCADAVEALRAIGPLVEIGAGSGCWSALLQAAGIDVVATDKDGSGRIGYGFQLGAHCEVEGLPATEAVRRHTGRSVFCSWPTEGDDWALDAAREIEPGRHFALIGDGPDGVIGTPALYRFLSDEFEIVEEVEIPQFPKVKDWLVIYRR